MSSLPPVCNLFAVYQRAPEAREALLQEMQGGGEFSKVWQPVPGWVVGARPVPSSEPLSTGCWPAIVCADGLDQLESLNDNPKRALERVAELTVQTPERLAQVPGDFTFLHLERAGRATAVRSCSGRVPLFLAATRDGCAIATRLDYILRYLPEERALDPLANGAWLSASSLIVDERSLFKGVRALQAGHFARVSPERLAESQRYWDPRPERVPVWNPQVAEEHAERLRELLLRSLDRELAAEGENAVFMSGGVDSSALTWLAARTLGRRVSTLTYLPPDAAERRRELSYIEPLRRELALTESVEVVCDNAAFVDLARRTPDTVFQVVATYNGLQLVNARLGSSARVVVTGQFADQVSGSRLLLADWLASTPPKTLLTLGRRVPVGRRIPLLWGTHRLRRLLRRPRAPWPKHLPTFIQEPVEREYQEWRRARRRDLALDGRPLPMLFRFLQNNGWLASLWEGSTTQDTRPFCPFYSRAVLELAFEAHPLEQFDSQTKKLLRNALRADVPPNNLMRPDKGRTSDLRYDGGMWRDYDWPREVVPFVSVEKLLQSRGQAFSVSDVTKLIVLLETVANARRCRPRDL